MRIAVPMQRQRGRVLGWVLLIILVGSAYWAVREYAPEYLPAPLRPPRAEPGTESAAKAATPAVDTRQAANPPLYKWKDERGQWQITDKPPRGRSYETVRVNPETNVVPAFVPPVVEEDLPEDIDEIDEID